MSVRDESTTEPWRDGGGLVESTVMGINFVVKVSDLHVHILGNSYLIKDFGISREFLPAPKDQKITTQGGYLRNGQLITC